jgi:hypothetical protein
MPRDAPAPDHAQKPGAPSIRLFSGEWVGYGDTHPVCSSGAIRNNGSFQVLVIDHYDRISMRAANSPVRENRK